MRDIVVMEWLHNGKVIFRGTWSPDDTDHYVARTVKQFGLSSISPIRALWFTWISSFNNYGTVFEPKLVRQWMA